MKTRRLMVLGASITNTASLTALAELRDIDLIVVDGNRTSVGQKIANHFECIDITDREAVLAAAKKYDIDGIFSINDHGMRSAAYAAGELGLRGMNMATTNAVLDKGTMREVWHAAGIPQPQFKIVTSRDEIGRFGARVGYPIVIKPADCGGGGRGVAIIHSPEDIGSCFDRASRYLQRCARLIVEAFVDGTQTSVEVVRVNDRTHIVAFSEWIMAPLSSRVGTDISYPGRFAPATVEKIGATSDKIMKALGLNPGIGHIEYIITADGSPMVLEIGARAGGGHTFHPIASHVSGVNYPEWIARFYLGDPLPLPVKPYRGACYSFFYAETPGELRSVTGLETARQVPHIHAVECWKSPGDHVSILENSMERVGCIVSLADTREDAVHAVEQARRAIRLEIKPTE